MAKGAAQLAPEASLADTTFLSCVHTPAKAEADRGSVQLLSLFSTWRTQSTAMTLS